MQHASTRQILVGLVLALALGVLLVWSVLEASRQTIVRSATEQNAVVAAAAVAEVVVDVQAREGDVQTAVQDLTAALDPVLQVRVIDSAGRRLMASTNPDDIGAGAIPRRLARDQKAWFDQAKELAAAHRTNVDEGKARKDEVLRAVTDDEALEIVLPLMTGDAVTGSVQVLTTAVVPASRGAGVIGLLVVVAAAIALLIWSRIFAGGWLLFLGGLALVVAGIWLVPARGLGGRAETRLGIERELAAHALDLRGATSAHVEAAAGSTLAITNWNLDRYGQPRATFNRSGVVDTLVVSAGMTEGAGRFKQGALLLGLISLVVYYWIGAGWALRTWRALTKHRSAYGFVLPAMIGMILLVFFPFFYGVTLSFTNQTLYNVNQPMYELWVGIDNYIDILSDVNIVKTTESGDRLVNYQNFYWTLGFTILWTVSNVTIGVTLGLILALILNTKDLAFRPLYRIILILPWAVPNYITALIWKGMFHRQFGVINQVIQMAGGEPIAWFDAWHTSFFAVLATNGWLSFPFMMVVSLGALQSISGDLYEAARVDGAGRWQQFRFVTMPSIKPAIVPAIILSVVWTFNMFNIIYLVSQGEPAGATEILITDAYKIAFEQYRYGYAAAYSVVIFLILLIYGVWQNRVTKATEGI